VVENPAGFPLGLQKLFFGMVRSPNFDLANPELFLLVENDDERNGARVLVDFRLRLWGKVDVSACPYNLQSD